METAPRLKASLASRTRRFDSAGYAELVVQVGEVLLDRRLRDHELVGDRARRRRLGEHVAGEQRAAQRDEHVALARGERRRRRPRPRSRRRRRRAKSRKIRRVWPTRISSPWRSRCDDQIRSPLTQVPFDEPRSVTHQPAGNRSRTACRRLAVGSSASGTSFSSALPMVGPVGRRARAASCRAADMTSTCGPTAAKRRPAQPRRLRVVRCRR